MLNKQFIRPFLVVLSLVGSLYFLFVQNSKMHFIGKTKLKVKIIQPHWPTKDIDPMRLFSIGDWAILQNLYATLVEPAHHDTVVPALAESWEQSTDGKKWIFKLKNQIENRKIGNE